MENEFDILAAKVLAKEASPSEQSRFEALLGQSPERRHEFDELAATWKLLQTTAPLVHALDAPSAPIPEVRLRQLLASVKPIVPFPQLRRKGPSLWLLAASVAVLGCVASILFFTNRPGSNQTDVGARAYLLTVKGRPEVRRAGKTFPAQAVIALRLDDELLLSAETRATLVTSNGAVALRGPQSITVGKMLASRHSSVSNAPSTPLQAALFSPPRQLPAAGLLVTMRGSESIPLYSPVAATVNLTPLILWKAETGKTYDLLITDEFKPTTPPWRIAGVTSPVDFAKVETWKDRPLAKDGLYRLSLSQTGQPLTTSEYTFRTLGGAGGSSPGSPAEKLLSAFEILTSDRSRIGDALAALLTLPPELAKSELSLRLKLMVFGQLGYQADFNRATAELQSTLSRE